MFKNEVLVPKEQEEKMKETNEALDFLESLTPTGKNILYNLIGAAEFFEKAGMLKKSA